MSEPNYGTVFNVVDWTDNHYPGTKALVAEYAPKLSWVTVIDAVLLALKQVYPGAANYLDILKAILDKALAKKMQAESVRIVGITDSAVGGDSAA